MIKKEYYNIETTPMTYHNIVKALMIILIISTCCSIFVMEFIVKIIDVLKLDHDFYIDNEVESFLTLLQNVLRIDLFSIIYYTISIFLLLITTIGLFKMKWKLICFYLGRYILLVFQNVISLINHNINNITPITNILIATLFLVPTAIYYLKRRPLFSPYEMTYEEEKIYNEQKKENIAKKEEYTYSI